jgi:hypothetical protein
LALAFGCLLLVSLPLWAADESSPQMTSNHAIASAGWGVFIETEILI